MSLRLTCARTSVNMDEAESPPGTTPSAPTDSLSRFFPMSATERRSTPPLHVLQRICEFAPYFCGNGYSPPSI